jgi:hypothetical protein
MASKYREFEAAARAATRYAVTLDTLTVFCKSTLRV